MPQSSIAQDYLKAIYHLQRREGGNRVGTGALASWLSIAPASVTGMIKKLAEHGYITHSPYQGVALTPQGEKAALETLRHHRLLETFLSERVGMPWEEVHAEADRLEHALSERLEERLDALLGYPTTDPHGAPIPTKEGTITAPTTIPLWQARPGSSVTVAEVEDEDAVLRLVEAFPQLLVFRTFSKIYGLSGLRAGYVVGSPRAAELLAAVAPVLGVNALTQAGVRHALKIADRELTRRQALVFTQRRRLLDALHELPVDAPPTQANFVWLRATGLSGAELAARLERAAVLVSPGGPLGSDDHVRAAIRGPAETDRLLAALTAATASAPEPAAPAPTTAS